MTWRSRSTRRLAAVLLCMMAAPAFATAGLGAPGPPTTLFPNLKTTPPADLYFDTVVIDGEERKVLRFANTVWNAGQGPLELRGDPDTGELVQRLYDDAGGHRDRAVPDGAFEFHPQHDHWHFVGFARYELWDLDPKRDRNRVLRRGTKTTFCIIDYEPVENRPGSPEQPTYDTCYQDVQGLSVGWGDTYGAHLYDQWIVLGAKRLRNGKYALRSVADPRNLLGEGGRRQNSERNNKAVTCFVVKGESIRPTKC